jgi:putative ABC transport system permease protein
MTTRLMKTALRNITRNMRRSLLSGIAIAVAAMSIVMLFSLIGGMRADMETNLKDLYSGSVQLQHADYEEYERYNPVHLTVPYQEISEVLDSIDGITTYVPRTTFPSSLYIDETTNGAIGVGVDFAQEARYHDVEAIVHEGRLPRAGENEIIMGGNLAQDLQLRIGDRVTILSTTAARGTNAITMEIVGIAAFPVGAMNTSTFWAPLDRVQYFLRMDAQVQRVLIKTDEKVNEQQLAATISQELSSRTGETYDVRSWKEINLMYSFIELAQLIYYFVGVFFFLLGSTVIINTTMMVIFERMREIGTLAALGMHGKELVRLFFLEGAFIATIGSLIGVLAGVGITSYLSRVGIDFTDALSGMDFEISSVLYPQLNVWITFFVFFYSVAIASLATLLPSKRAAKIEPVEALRYI